MPYLHDLAVSQLHSWLSAQKDVSGFQVQAPLCLQEGVSIKTASPR